MARPKKVAPKGRGVDVKARYDAAGTGRRMSSWTPPSSGPNVAITGAQKVRDRSHDAVRNDWSGESSVSKWTTNLIGTGIVPRWESEAARVAWDEWVPFSDADGVLDFYGQETLATRAWLEGGELLGRLRYRRSNSGLAVPMQVQLLEPEFLPLLDTTTWPGLARGNTIRSGIERNSIGARMAYWMYANHPGDGTSSVGIDPARLLRIPANEVIHMFEPKRAGQLRGISSLAPILARLRNIADFDDTVLDRQKLANLFTMFITRAMPTGTDVEFDADTGLPAWYDTEGNKVAKLSPGMSQELLPGEDVKFANPPEAGTTFSDYMRTQHMGTAAGQGLPYELFSGDIKEVSDRTLRVIINEFHRFAEQRQWQIIIPQFCRRVTLAWALTARLAGVLTSKDSIKHTWSPHGWQYIHPVQDVQGKAAEVAAGFRSRSSVVSERGDDPEQVDKERLADQQREKDLGIIDPKAAANPKAKPEADGDGIAPGEYPQPKKAMADLTARVEGLHTLIQARAGEPAPAPVFNMTANITTPPVAVTNVVEPTPVTNVLEQTINNVIEPTPITNVLEQTVNVEPTPITNVLEQTVVAQAGEVTVNLPDRKTETTVEYDAKDRIKKSTQIETNLDQPETRH